MTGGAPAPGNGNGHRPRLLPNVEHRVTTGNLISGVIGLAALMSVWFGVVGRLGDLEEGAATLRDETLPAIRAAITAGDAALADRVADLNTGVGRNTDQINALREAQVQTREDVAHLKSTDDGRSNHEQRITTLEAAAGYVRSELDEIKTLLRDIHQQIARPGASPSSAPAGPARPGAAHAIAVTPE